MTATRRQSRRPRRAALQSMTGYGRATRRDRGGSITVELRSTNHRYLEVDQRLPNGLNGVQKRFAELIRQHVRRGRVDATISFQGDQQDRRRVVLDERLCERYVEALRSLKARFGLKGSVTLDQIAGLPHAMTVTDAREPTADVWPSIRRTAQTAVEELVHTREREGQKLVADLLRQIREVERHARAVKTRLPKALHAQRRQTRIRLLELLGTTGARRKARTAPVISRAQLQEAVTLVKDVDVHEELVRLTSHLTHMRQTLSTQRLVGKQLDFIAQELMRETNTLGAKVNDAHAARHVVEMKGAIERIREQVQNLE